MDYLFAKKVIKSHKLIPRNLSKKIINFINFEDKNLETDVTKFIPRVELLSLKKEFITFKKKINNTFSKPKNRNFYIYKFIESKNRNFRFKIKSLNSKEIVDMPEIKGIKVTLATLLLMSNNILVNNTNHKKFNISKGMNLDLVDDIINLIDNNNLLIDKTDFKNFYSLIQKGLKGEKITFFSPVCPDYSYKKIAEDLYLLTFEDLGTNIGVVASRIKKYINNIYNLFEKYDINYNHIIAVGDFEVLSESNLKKLNINKDEFLKRVKISQKRIQTSFKKSKSKYLFTEHFGGLKKWEKKNDFGKSQLKKKYLEEIILSREQLYKRWFGKITKRQMLDKLIAQAAEYALMGNLIKKKYKNVFILGADHSKMSKFYSILNSILTIYIKKNYKT